jgi:esterase/lipase
MAMADDVVALLDHLLLRKAHIVGYSLGGIITLKLATTHLERMQTAPRRLSQETGTFSQALGEGDDGLSE